MPLSFGIRYLWYKLVIQYCFCTFYVLNDASRMIHGLDFVYLSGLRELTNQSGPQNLQFLTSNKATVLLKKKKLNIVFDKIPKYLLQIVHFWLMVVDGVRNTTTLWFHLGKQCTAASPGISRCCNLNCF